MGEAAGKFMNSGVPPWDAPPHFFLWMKATESNDFDLVMRLPLSKNAWLAAQWLFRFAPFQRRYTKLTFDMLRAILAKR